MALASRRWIHRFLWVLLALFCMEGVLRLTVRYSGNTYAYDGEWGSRKTAGSYVRWGTEGFGLTRYSAIGEIETPFSGGANVVMFGDSHTEAFQVGSDDNFVSIAERRLRSNGVLADLRNLGESGLDLVDYIYRIPVARKSLDPKAIIIQLTTTDFEEVSGRSVNVLVDTEGEHPVIRHGTPRNLSTTVWRIKESLSLLDYGGQRFKEIFLRRPGPIPATREMASSDNSRWRHGVRRRLIALQDVLGGLPTVILPLPYEPLLADKQIVKTSTRYGILLEELRRTGGWEVIDPSDEFNELIQQGRFPRGFSNSTFPGSGHLNQAGHDIVGRLLSERLSKLLR